MGRAASCGGPLAFDTQELALDWRMTLALLLMLSAGPRQSMMVGHEVRGDEPSKGGPPEQRAFWRDRHAACRAFFPPPTPVPAVGSLIMTMGPTQAV